MHTLKKAEQAFLVIVLSVLVICFGCTSQPAGLEEASGGTIRFSAKTVQGLAKLQSADIVQLDRARLVVKTIRLHEQGGGVHRVGPFVFDLNLEGNLNGISATLVPFGTYHRVDLLVTRLTDADLDGLSVPDRQAFLDFMQGERSSAIAEGQFIQGGSAHPFRYHSRIHAEQTRELNPPINITPEFPSANLTLLVDTDRWFRDQDGNILDPTNSNNVSLIESNIHRSITMIHDDNQDGEDDHGDGTGDHDGDDDGEDNDDGDDGDGGEGHDGDDHDDDDDEDDDEDHEGEDDDEDDDDDGD